MNIYKYDDPDEAFRAAERAIDAAERDGATTLNLRRYGLTALPERIGDLTALHKLDVGGNELTALPERIGDLAALQELHVRYNKLTALPERIGDLTALQELDVSGNQLTALPERIGDLTALQRLNVSHNQLIAMPERIGDLTALQRLDVSYNQLTVLPESIGDLTALQRLDVSGNVSVALFGNPLQDPPYALATGTRKLLYHYLTMRERVEDGEPVTVRYSGPASIALGIRSRLAVLETVIAVIVALGIAIWGHALPLWSAAVIAPFLLTGTDRSRTLGLDRYARACRILAIRTGYGHHWLPLPLRLLALGCASLGIKFWTASGALLSHPFTALSAIPANYRFYLSCTDALSPPELVPGAAGGITPAGEPILAASDLRHDYRQAPRTIMADSIYSLAGRNVAVSVIGYATLGIFLVFAWAYRWSIKASVIIYWPFLLFTPTKITAADAVDDSSGKKKPVFDRAALISFQTLLLAQSTYFLLRRGAPEVAAPLLSRLPEALQGRVSDLAGIVESFPPALSLTWLQLAIFTQAVLFFARGVPRYYLAHYGANPPDGIDRFMLNAVMTCRMLQNLALAAASLYFFLWGVVWAPTVAEAVVTFFARLASGG